MKKRYYLRGLGLGILFTTVFFMLGGNSEPMSDEMIKERARELGMVESTVLADMNSSTGVEEEILDEETVSTVIAEETVEITVEETISVEEIETDTTEEADSEVETTVEETETVEESTAEEPETTTEAEAVEENSAEESNQTGQLISVIVNKGEGSDTVSRRLYELGLVDDSYEFDRYLMQNGYDKRIGAGEHLIPLGASWQEIAKLLTS